MSYSSALHKDSIFNVERQNLAYTETSATLGSHEAMNTVAKKLVRHGKLYVF